MISFELITLGVNAIVVAVFYHTYQRYRKSADAIKNSPNFEIGDELKTAAQNAKDKVLPYVCLTGMVTALEKPLTSHFTDNKGVIQKLLLQELRTRRSRGFWTDSIRVLRDTFNIIPFALESRFEGDKLLVHVLSPKEASGISHSIVNIYEKFEPSACGWIEKSLERIAGEVTKGFHESELMLLVDSKLTAIGEVFFENNTLKIRPPKNELPYILIDLTKQDIIKRYEARSSIFKVLTSIFALTATAITVIYLRRLFSDWRRRREDDAELAEIQNHFPTDNESKESNLCIICVTRQREVVFLDCGHICSCRVCAMRLPTPRICPLCRAGITRIIPVYNP